MTRLPAMASDACPGGSGRGSRPDLAVVLEAHRLSKRFFGVPVLEAVSLRLRAGEVRALLGENGAGKSTLINLLSGVHRPDDGEVLLDGSAVRFVRPRDGDHAGISVIRQELSLFPDLSIAEAIFAGHLPVTRLGLVDWSRIRSAAREALARLGLRIDVRRPVSTLSIAEQQLVEIARALTRRSRVVIMDEPTASLSPNEVEGLGRIIARLASEGVAILYVSHRLAEIRAFCDSFTVLRDGRVVAEGAVGAVATEALITAMAGREIRVSERAENAAQGPKVLELRHLRSAASGRRAARVRNVSLSLHAGEILGLAGIVGAGRTETARMIFGLDAPGAGEMLLDGRSFRPRGPVDAMAFGIGFLPEDRKSQSILPQRSLLENFAIAGAVPARGLGRTDHRSEAAAFSAYADKLGIRCSGPTAAIATLSGGNQQKVVLARWIARQPRVLIVDEPTRGIDVGAKEDVHRLLRQIASRGTAVLLISSDLPEILTLSDRIITLCEGETTADLPATAATQESLMALMTRHA
jgi:ABC-type sugar transport system ATPase subunit